MKKSCDPQYFMSLELALEYIRYQEHDNITPIKRIYLEALNV